MAFLLRGGMPSSPLRKELLQDAERPSLHSHAERGNESQLLLIVLNQSVFSVNPLYSILDQVSVPPVAPT
jgi:hypothetical protein